MKQPRLQHLKRKLIRSYKQVRLRKLDQHLKDKKRNRLVKWEQNLDRQWKQIYQNKLPSQVLLHHNKRQVLLQHNKRQDNKNRVQILKAIKVQLVKRLKLELLELKSRQTQLEKQEYKINLDKVLKLPYKEVQQRKHLNQRKPQHRQQNQLSWIPDPKLVTVQKLEQELVVLVVCKKIKGRKRVQLQKKMQGRNREVNKKLKKLKIIKIYKKLWTHLT